MKRYITYYSRWLVFVACFCFCLLSLSSEVAEKPFYNPYEAYLISQYYQHLDQPEQAEEYIDRGLVKYPEDPFLLTEKAYLLQNLKNDSETAVQLLEKAIVIYPAYYYSNYLLASLLYNLYGHDKAQITRAVKLLENSLKDKADFYDSNYLLGIIKNNIGEYADSNHYFEQANRLDEQISAYHYMASNYKKLNNATAEIATYKKILTLSPNNYKVIYELAQACMRTNDFKTACTYWEKLYTANPNSNSVLLEYLYSLFAAGEDEKFLKISTTIDLKNFPMLLYAKALILFRQRQLDQALQLLDSQPKKDFKSLLLISQIQAEKEDFFSALQTLEKIDSADRNDLYYSQKIQLFSIFGLKQRLLEIFELIRGNHNILQNLSISDYYSILYAYAQLNQLDKVKEVTLFITETLKLNSELCADLAFRLKDFSPDQETIIQGDPSKIVSNLFLLLHFYKHHYNTEAAISLLKQIIEKSSTPNLSAHMQLCEIYLKQNQTDKVELYLISLQKQFPDANAILNFRAYLWAEKNQNLEEALVLSAATLASEKDNHAYLDTYGFILLKLNRLAESQTYLEKAFQKNPFDPDIMEHLASCYQLQKKENQMIPRYQTAIDYGVDFKDQLIEKLKRLKTTPPPEHHE